MSPRLPPAAFAGAPVARLDADDSRTHRERWIDGEITCACPARRVDGVLVRDATGCTCSRMAMVDTENGPRLIPTACAPEEGDELNADADDGDDIDESSRSCVIEVHPHLLYSGKSITKVDLGRFRTNPIVFHNHIDTIPIARASEIADIGGGLLRMRVTFGDDYWGERTWRLVRGGFLRAASPKFSRIDDESGELLEVSMVELPAHRDSGIVRRPPRAKPTTRTDTSDEETTTRNNTDATTDLLDLRVALARATQHAVASTAWRSDAIPTRIVGKLGKLDVPARTVPILAASVDDVDGVALTSWDLTRYEKNPVVLWAHADRDLPVGTSSDVVFEPGVGLTARVRLATADANPLAEQIWSGIQQGLVRAVSVGYEFDAQTGTATLVEISFVPVGLDENAGTPDLGDDAATSAGRALAQHRHREERARIGNGTTLSDGMIQKVCGCSDVAPCKHDTG